MRTFVAQPISAQLAFSSQNYPLLDTLRRAGQLGGHLDSIQLAPEGDGWLPITALLASGGESVREMMGRIGSHYKSGKNRRMPATFFFGDYAFALLALANACYLLDRRVPRLTPETVYLRFGERGDVEGIALKEYGFAALANDPAANHPDCTVLSTPDALQDFLLEGALSCLQPMTQSVRATSPLGLPAMWALAADYAASAATYIARFLNMHDQGLELARQLSAKPTPLQRKRDFIQIGLTVNGCDLRYDMVDRTSCCLYYQTEEGHYCSTCPHRPATERVERITKWLTEEATKQKEAA
jgi:hypothetical protein